MVASKTAGSGALARTAYGGTTVGAMKQEIFKEFGVKNERELLKKGNFVMATSSIGVGKSDMKNPEKVADVYRKTIGVIKGDPANAPGTRGVVNGINVLKYDRPWEAFGLNPKTASDADIKSAYRKVAMKNHPDQGGDAATSEKLNNMYKSLTYKF